MEAIAVDTTTAAVGSDEQPAYRIFSFMIEAKTASDHEEFHEKARATIHQAQVLLEEEKKRTDICFFHRYLFLKENTGNG